MASKAAYITVMVISVSSITVLLFSKSIPYANYIAICLAVIAAFIAKVQNIDYSTLIQRKQETRVFGYILVLGGIGVMGLLNSQDSIANILSTCMIFLGALFVGLTLKNEKLGKL